MSLATINSIWIGTEPDSIHAACLRSFLLQGHRVALRAYQRPHDLPSGVELVDAARLLANRIINYSRGEASCYPQTKAASS